jgi:hypothetical protein
MSVAGESMHSFEGGCTCRHVRYRMTSAPLIVHCCHFVRVGTLDTPDALQPDVHIYTSTKQPWVQLPADAKAFPQYYKPPEVWPQPSWDRFAAAMANKR